MPKADRLTAAEMAGFRPNPEVLRYVLRGGAAPVAPARRLRVLDWGCGRGRLVADLLGRNVDAYGVDIDAGALDNGRPYFAALGEDADRRLCRLDGGLRTGFPDAFFDVVVSDNVLEHVADLDGVLAEIARITRRGGHGFHIFPARFLPVEGHLHMPLVHWIPKSPLRHAAIRCWVAIGVEPHWPEADSMSPAEKAGLYFRYSRDKTFYRSPAAILASCRRHGLGARLVGLDHPRIRRSPLLSRIAANGGGRLLQRLIAETRTVELYTEKAAA
jgi:SAM-dependent methyltransferase